MIQHDIKNLLAQWGAWARCRIGTEYPNISIFFKPMSKTQNNVCFFRDEELEKVDRAVCALKAYDELGYNITLAHYIYGLSFRKIGKGLDKSHGYVSDYISRAEFFIAGKLSR